jgi:hypothetical protein
MTVTDRHTACAVCAATLNPADPFTHECAVCDFCGTPGPDHTLPVQPFADRVRVGPRARDLGIVYDSGPGDWDTCTVCAALIRADDWDTLSHRAAALATLGPDPIRQARLAASLADLFTTVRDHTTGPLRPRTQP